MILTIDVGGTKTLLATFSSNGNKLNSLKIKTPKNYDNFLEEIKKTIPKLIDPEQLERCAIAVPGTIDRQIQAIKGCGNLGWKNIPIANDFQEILTCPIILENDAKAAALAEAEELKGQFSKIMYITISTGIGLGMVRDGHLDYNIHDSGGDGIKVKRNGNISRWEDFASGRALFEKTGQLASELEDPEQWRAFAEEVAVGLTAIMTLTTPECIVVGGGVGTHLTKFKTQLIETLQNITSLRPIPEILQAKNPEQAVIYGCYLLAKNENV